MSSQLLDAWRAGQGEQAAAALVTVDIRADVTPAVLARIQTLGGTVLSSVPKYRAIRARLSLTALEPLARLDAVQLIRPAEQPITHRVLARAIAAQAAVAANTRNTTESDVAHQANIARQTHSVDGTGIGIGVISDGVHTVVALADDEEFGRATFTVTTLGVEFLQGARGETVVADFPMPGETVTLEWQQNSQNFVITAVE